MGLQYKELSLFSLSEGRLRGDLIAAYDILTEGKYQVLKGTLFNLAVKDITRTHGWKLKPGVKLETRHYLLTARVVGCWTSYRKKQ